MTFKETDEVGFDADGFATHKKCGERLVEEWSITRTETYHIRRDGTMPLVGEVGDDKSCDGVWCGECDVRVTMEKG